MVDVNAEADLDSVITEIGAFGLFQLAALLLICIPNTLTSAYGSTYMITSNTIDYRCKVPNCDIGENNREISYDQPWLSNAIPSSSGTFDSCSHYALKDNILIRPGQCNANVFNTSMKVKCSEFVYASDEKNLQTEFNIHCDDIYKLALIGPINSLGTFVFLPLSGIMSDRYGRLTVIIIGTVLNSIFGLIKSFSFNYAMFISFEFLETVGGSCVYVAAYVLAIELVTSKYRVLASTFISVSYAFGGVLLGIVAMYVHDFRVMIWILYVPGLFIFVYFWLVPESFRWLFRTGHFDRAVNILKQNARINNKVLTTKSIEILHMKYSTDSLSKYDDHNKSNEESLTQSLYLIFKSKVLCLRFLNGCYQWIACVMCYYGLSISSVHIPGADRYISFIFVMAVEIPAVLLAQPLLSRMKRRPLLFATFAIAGISVISTRFIPDDYSIIEVGLLSLGKASVSIAFAGLYIFTAEQWPTNIRNTSVSCCSMAGRIGSMAAPFAVILFDTQMPSFSALLFGISNIIAAFCVLASPETLSKKLPDTIEEAINL